MPVCPLFKGVLRVYLGSARSGDFIVDHYRAGTEGSHGFFNRNMLGVRDVGVKSIAIIKVGGEHDIVASLALGEIDPDFQRAEGFNFSFQTLQCLHSFFQIRRVFFLQFEHDDMFDHEGLPEGSGRGCEEASFRLIQVRALQF